MPTHDLVPTRNTRHHGDFLQPLLTRLLAVICFFVAAAVVLILAQTWRHGEKIKEATVLEAAATYAGAVTAFRNFYGNEIVPRARRAGIEITHDYHDKEAALPLPATMSLELGDRLGGADQPFLRLYSEYPFPYRADRSLTSSQIEALRAVIEQPNEPFVRFVSENGIPSVQHATAVLMGAACVDCHNSHATRPRKDWKVGDVREVQLVTLPLPVHSILTTWQLAESSAFVVVVSGFGLFLITLLVRQLGAAVKRTQALADDAARRGAAKTPSFRSPRRTPSAQTAPRAIFWPI